MRHALSLALLATLAPLFVACSATTEPQTHYLLRGAPITEPLGHTAAPLRVSLTRVDVAAYLDQAGIVIETEPGQVQPARLHRWAEPVHDGLLSYLRTEISRALGYDISAGPADGADLDFAIDVYIDRMHGNMDGTAVLEAAYRIVPRATPGEPRLYRFADSRPLPREGYPGLVDAEAELARQLAVEIAASLQRVSAR